MEMSAVSGRHGTVLFR